MGNSLEKQIENPANNTPRETENEDISSFTCEICIEPMLKSKKFINKTHCTHPFCQDCISKYIQVKVEEDGITSGGNINCPGLNCPYLLDPLSCRDMISPGVFLRWCDLLCESAVLEFERRSYCPNRDCLELVLNECGGTERKTKCPKCKQVFCFQCKTEWHAGFGCEESRDRNDVLFGELMEKKKWRRCPHCGHCVERLHGCSVVKCRCKTQFCYHCGEKLTTLHNGCGCSFVQQVHTSCRDHFIFIAAFAIIILLMFLILYLSPHRRGDQT
ncbi:probable E3 ubiquitin-protein ligase RNF144A [Tripterygium wilfordii]|uniref:probable E3 ubiquitin-protein ligase RNF144A n=1 Tax=Tripterygium wilfordii TaxID=458696 RepID=UPI0018F837AE|nr:probable E3 ubiquitin-protein ligase RNF144A [Tripterygium wilfordii]